MTSTFIEKLNVILAKAARMSELHNSVVYIMSTPDGYREPTLWVSLAQLLPERRLDQVVEIVNPPSFYTVQA